MKTILEASCGDVFQEKGTKIKVHITSANYWILGVFDTGGILRINSATQQDLENWEYLGRARTSFYSLFEIERGKIN